MLAKILIPLCLLAMPVVACAQSGKTTATAYVSASSSNAGADVRATRADADVHETAPTVSPRTPIKIVLDGARTPGECAVEGRAVQQELRTLGYPPGWTIAIMCTPVRWETIVQQVNPPRTHMAFTRISERITVLNGAIFRDFQKRYRHVLAHELAHIQCNCADEDHVEKLAGKLERQVLLTLQ